MRSSNTSRSAMRQQVTAWEQSGLSKKEWCRQEHIAYATFQYWCQRLAEEPITGGQPAFLPVALQPASAFPSSTPFASLRLTDGSCLDLHQPVSSDYLRHLLS